MNILPKKSWHVRTKKNIERVQRDEAEAERLARIEQDRILNVEQEIRMRELRARSGIAEPPDKHFNLFEDYQDKQQTGNKDHEAEKRQDEAKFQKSFGIFNKLVSSKDVNKPWYCSSKPTTVNLKEDSSESRGGQLLHHPDKKYSKSDLITRFYDPMTAIKEAEEIIKLKRLKKGDSDYIEFTDNKEINSVENKRIVQPKTSITEDLASSPEIIRIIGPTKASSKRKKNKKKI